jgi:hypothetical protein
MSALQAVTQAMPTHFSACDIDAFMPLYAPGVEFFAPDLTAPVLGLPALRAHLSGA